MSITRENIKKLFIILLLLSAFIICIMKFDVIFSGIGSFIGILEPFFIGGIIAFILNIPMSFFEHKIFTEKRMKGRPHLAKASRALSILLTVAVVLVIAFYILSMVMPQIAASLETLAANIGTNLKVFQGWLEDLGEISPELGSQIVTQIDFSKVSTALESNITSWASEVLSSSANVIASIASAVMTTVIGIIFAFYILAQKETLTTNSKKLLVAVFSQKQHDSILKVLRMTNKAFHNFVGGQCTEAVITGIMFYVVLKIMNFDYALLISVIVGVFTFIPIFGAIIGTIIGAVLVMSGGFSRILIYLAVTVILQQIESNLIYPHVVGGSIGLPAIWILVAVTVGGSMFGIAGMIIFIPIFSVIYMLSKDWINKRYQNKILLYSDEKQKEEGVL